MNKLKIYPVILAGGSGTRLWPFSREATPKQLLSLTDEKSLIEKSVARCKYFTKENVRVVAIVDLAEKIRHHTTNDQIIYIEEPMKRGTAAAIALAVREIYKKDPTGVIAVLTADHELDDQKLAEDLKMAAHAASRENSITLLGIKPTSPETGYGYIKLGKKLDGFKDCYVSGGFVEKPNKDTAEKYLRNGNYLWNSGMFVATAETFVQEFKRHLPQTASLIAATTSDVDKVFGSLPKVSFDDGVLEKTKNITVLETDIYWNDLGSWQSVYELLPKDEGHNYIDNGCISQNNDHTMIFNKKDRLVVGIGLKNTVIVDTEDATLVCDMDMTQEVKEVVETIKQSGRKEHLEHKTTHRPWGRYTILDEGEGFKVKFIHVKPGAKLSLQSHKHRSEHWIVVKGEAKITNGDKVIILKQNESTFIPAKSKHRLENDNKSELTIVEVQSGSYLGEDDIVRYDDMYERK